MLKEKPKMPPIINHLKTSIERTGKDYKEIHDWIDGDPAKRLKDTTSQRFMSMER